MVQQLWKLGPQKTTLFSELLIDSYQKSEGYDYAYIQKLNFQCMTEQIHVMLSK